MWCRCCCLQVTSFELYTMHEKVHSRRCTCTALLSATQLLNNAAWPIIGLKPRRKCWVVLGNACALAPLVGDQVNQDPYWITLQALTLLNHCSLIR